MTSNDYYSWSNDWRLETIERPLDMAEGTEYFLENARRGKIIIDKPVNNVLEFLATADTVKTFAEIERQKMVSSGFLEIILKAFVQAGVLELNRDEWKEPEVIEIDLKAKNPLISVVIVNYKGLKHLPQLLNSLRYQIYTNQEVILVDICPTTRSSNWLNRNYPKIRVLSFEQNIGFAAGVNLGIREAQGEYILVLNNDIVADENAIYYLVQKAITLSYGIGAKKWAAIVPKMKFFNNPGFINAIGNSLYPITWGSDNFIGSLDMGQFNRFKYPMSACFGAVLLRREVLETIGLLDLHYRFYYEDMDWSFRAQLCGYSIEAAPKAIFYHKFGASMSLKSQAFKLRFIVGNRLYFTLKNLEGPTIRRFLRNYIWEDIKSALIYLKRKNFSLVGAYIWGYTRFFLSLPGLCLKRYRVQEQREDHGVSDATILARSVPLNSTFMENGVPVLDVYSLRTNYASLEPENFSNSSEPDSDIISWRLRPPPRNKQSTAKMYMDFSFYLAQPGYYDIHLLGLIKRKSDRTVYLDGQRLKPPIKVDKKNKRLIMNFLAGESIHITQGRHFLELGWRSQVYAVVVRKSKASEGKEFAVDN